jgi:hypothetical protein
MDIQPMLCILTEGPIEFPADLARPMHFAICNPKPIIPVHPADIATWRPGNIILSWAWFDSLAGGYSKDFALIMSKNSLSNLNELCAGTNLPEHESCW